MNGTRLDLAQRLTLAVPAALLAGAYISQYGFDLYPCEMCWWQRYPHFAAIALAVGSFAVGSIAVTRRPLIMLAGLAILASGLIGGFHAGVEYGWWEGITGCASAAVNGAGSALDDILSAPLVRCDAAPWTLAGISLAGFNFLFSSAVGITILWLASRNRTA